MLTCRVILSRHRHFAEEQWWQSTSTPVAVSTWPTPSCSFHFMPFVENQQAWRPAMPSGILRDATPELSTDSRSMLVNSSGSAEWSYGAQSTEAGRRCLRRLQRCRELQQLQLQLRPLQAGSASPSATPSASPSASPANVTLSAVPLSGWQTM